MQFKIGDKVRFLDEKGGGTVIAILDNRMIKIETEDGFDLPVLSSELILDYRAQASYEEKAILSHKEKLEKVQPEVVPESNTSLINPWGKVKEEEGIYLAYEPHDQQWMLTGDLDVILVNHTPFDILYSLFLETEEILKGVDYGSIPGNSKTVLATISRDDIEDWTKGALQILVHQETVEKLYLPIHADVNVRVSRFFKEGSYTSNTLVSGKALISVIAQKSAFQYAGSEETNLKIGSRAQTVQSKTKTEIPFIDRYKTQYGEAIVDLHIGEIVNNIAGLSSRDMFEIQIEHFKKALDSAIENDYNKVTFIHGVGNGTLKNALIDALKNYENLKNKRASISKFGVGALDVLIGSE
ncbi:MAG: DUF2027 domain-containing protein [Bacteroidales bacterium]|nr:DUF2027 domain-containing protein [Bacteroidales bacterium]